MKLAEARASAAAPKPPCAPPPPPCCRSPGLRPGSGGRRRALVAHEAAVQGVVDVVCLGHVHHEVGGRAKPVAAGEEQLSARGQVVGAHDVPRICRQGQGVAVHAHSRGVRGQDHAAAAAGADRQFDSETSVGPRICSPMAATTSSAPPCYLQRRAASVTPSWLVVNTSWSGPVR